MDSQMYFEIVHYLKSGIYPRNSTWIYRRERENSVIDAKTIIFPEGFYCEWVQGSRFYTGVTHEISLLKCTGKTIIPPEKIWNLWRGKHLVSATYECGAEKS